MNRNSDSLDASLAASLADRLDRACDSFEAAWKSGARPSIRDYLLRFAEADQPTAFGELLAVEIAYRALKGDSPTPEEYLSAFPDFSEFVETVFSQAASVDTDQNSELQTPRQDRTPAGDDTTGSSTVSNRFGRFELIERLGEGAFGTVYLARDPQLDRRLALKIPRWPLLDQAELNRFVREGRAAAQLKHPNIVQILEAGEIEGICYIASIFIEGQTLRQRLSSGPAFTPREAATLVRKLAYPLHFAHGKGIIHRDIKPENVMLDAAGEPHLMDFGLARRDEGDVLRTREGTQMGTPAYMSPEQVQGQSHLADSRSDIWALGVVLYELLCGQRPFRGHDIELFAAIVNHDPKSPRQVLKSVPADLSTICLKCLKKNPDERYPSCQHLAEDLERWSNGEPVQARPVTAAGRAYRWARRKPLRATALLTAATILIAAITYWQTRPAYLDLRIVPANAQVTFDGKPLPLEQGQALATTTPGNHELIAEAPGYESKKQPVTLVRGRGNAARVQIDLKSSFGYLQVASIPTGAAVSVVDPEGKVVSRGVTPFHSSRLPSGPYSLNVEKVFHQPGSVAVTVPSGDTVAEVPSIKLTAHIQGAEGLELLLAVNAVLERRVSKPWKFADMPLTDFPEFLRKTEGIVGEFDFRAISDAGIDLRQPCSVNVSGGKLRDALVAVLQPVSLSFLPVGDPSSVRFQVTTTEAARRNQVTIIYPVGDLIEQGPLAANKLHELSNSIRVAVAPNTWDSVGGPGTIAFSPVVSGLAVSQSWNIQFRVYAYLNDLRRTRGLEESSPPSSAQPATGAFASESYRRALGTPLSVAPDGNSQPLKDQQSHLRKASESRVVELAGVGKWQAVADLCGKLVESDPGNPARWYEYAIALLAAGRYRDYQQICTKMLAQFGDTTDGNVAARVLYTCVPAPNAVPDAGKLVSLALKAASVWKGSYRLVGAALYRAGGGDAALHAFNEAAAALPPRAWDWFFLAMIHHREGRTDEARRCLAEGIRWHDDISRRDPDATKGEWAWTERVEVEQLRKEAEALLGNQEAEGG